MVTWQRKIVIASAALLAVTGASVLTSRALARGVAPAPARQAAAANTITVSANGTVQVAPDQASLTLGVDTRGPSAQDALSRNADKMNAVIAALKAQGVASKDIQTSNLSLSYDRESDSYTASHQLTVTTTNISGLGQILDAAVAAGANNSWGVSFGLQDPTVAQSRALKAAVAAGRAHADAIASALGVSISGVRSASEPTYTNYPVYASGAAAPVAAAPTPIQEGQLSISATIQLVYTF